MAIMAALSVVKRNGGIKTSQWRFAASRVILSRNPLLADTPPARATRLIPVSLTAFTTFSNRMSTSVC